MEGEWMPEKDKGDGEQRQERVFKKGHLCPLSQGDIYGYFNTAHLALTKQNLRI